MVLMVVGAFFVIYAPLKGSPRGGLNSFQVGALTAAPCALAVGLGAWLLREYSPVFKVVSVLAPIVVVASAMQAWGWQHVGSMTGLGDRLADQGYNVLVSGLGVVLLLLVLSGIADAAKSTPRSTVETAARTAMVFIVLGVIAIGLTSMTADQFKIEL